jgi:hypothetical protein
MKEARAEIRFVYQEEKMTDHSRRAWCLTAGVLLLALPIHAGTLLYTGLTETNQYSPGNQSFDATLDPAHSNDNLSITKNIFAPDSVHTAFLGGDVLFGRLTSAAAVGAQPVANPSLPFFSTLTTKFTDTLTISGASSGFLSLDIGLHGVLSRSDTTGANSQGELNIFAMDSGGNVSASGAICMFWEAGSAPILCGPGLVGVASTLFSAMSITPDGLGGWVFQGDARVLLPFTGGELGFSAQLTTLVGCKAPCSASADLGHTALFGGYQILDSAGHLIPGATLTSESGYDYVTPPSGDAAAVPEPATSGLIALAGLAMWGRRRRCAV